MLVLGCVKAFQPIHGYDVRRELMSWHANEWAHVAPGSIYGALKTLVKDGALEVVGTKVVGGRPERTSYKLTKRGEQELVELLHHRWWTVEDILDPLMSALAFLNMIPRDEAIAALESRSAKLRTEITQAEFLIPKFGADDNVGDEHVREMMRLRIARAEAEVAWAAGLISRLKKGEYTLLGEPFGKKKKR